MLLDVMSIMTDFKVSMNCLVSLNTYPFWTFSVPPGRRENCYTNHWPVHSTV